MLTGVLMLYVSPQWYLPQASYKLYDNQPQCVWFSHRTRHFQQCVLLSCCRHIVSLDTMGGKPICVNKFLIQVCSCHICHRHVLLVCSWLTDHALLLTFPWHNFLQENISCSRPLIKKTPCPVCIGEAYYSDVLMIWIEKPSSWSFLQISQIIIIASK